MKKHVFYVSVIGLVIVLTIVSFYMLFVHIPYYQHYHALINKRNQICEQNQYEYMDYFNEYYGKETYDILKVNINQVLTYVVYNADGELVDSYQGEVADEDEVKQAIYEKYQIEADELEIAYENDKLVYHYKYQDDHTLIYIFYDLISGDFMKAVRLEN